MWKAAARHPGYHCGRSSPLADQIEMLVVVVGIAVTTPASITAFKIARPGQLSADSP
jgi:hypothetical protein